MMDNGHAGMAGALRLVRAGRLLEATAAIQRELSARSGSASFPAVPETQDAPAPDVSGVSGLPSFPSEVSAAGARPLSGFGQMLRRLRTVPTDLDDQLAQPGFTVPEPVRVPPGDLGAGQLVDGSFTNLAGTRNYKTYIPAGCTGQDLPVIVMLHGGTQAVPDFAAGTRMNDFADRDSFLVVYPEQDVEANPMKYWNWFRPVDQERGGGEPSLVAGITRQVVRTYAADTSRVYVAGFSAGGAMAVVMAATYPDLYAAAGVHSGLPYRSAHDLSSAFAAMRGKGAGNSRRPDLVIPLIVFHGDRDEVVDVVNAHRILEQCTREAGQANVCRGRVDGGHAYTQSVYPGVDGTVMEQWIIHEAGHAWSGGNPLGSYTDPQGPDATEEMVRFFSDYTR